MGRSMALPTLADILEASRAHPERPHAEAVDAAVLDACVERARQTLAVRADARPVPALPGLDERMVGSTRTRFGVWLVRANALGADHPMWDALVAEGLDARWTVDPGFKGNDGWGRTVLHECSHHDLVDATEGLAAALARAGQPLNVLGGRFHESPLATGVRTGGLVCTEGLLNAGADALGDAHGGSLLWLATLTDPSHAHAPRLVQALLKHGAGPRIDEPGANGMTPLHQAVLSDREPLVMFLLKGGADPRVPNADGDTARDMAQRRGRIEVCRRIDERWAILEQAALRDALNTTPDLPPSVTTGRARSRL